MFIIPHMIYGFEIILKFDEYFSPLAIDVL